jgi:dCTP deaminase
MILTGIAIDEAVGRGEIVIDPYDQGQLNPASYDLRLGDEVAVYDEWIGAITMTRDGGGLFPRSVELDSKRELKVRHFKIGPDGWVLNPGIGYLLCTKERVCAPKLVGCVDGKSSLGRLFIQVHSTAGYIDPSFDGQITLEATATHPVRIYAHMRIAQIRFHRTDGPITPYKGNYTGDAARGPVASRAWKQFKEK